MIVCTESVGCFPLLYAVLLGAIIVVGWHGARLLSDDKITWREFALRWWLTIFTCTLILAILYLIERLRGY